MSHAGEPTVDLVASGVTRPPDLPGTHVTTAEESWALLRQGVVGRLAVISDGAPEIFPVNYAVDHDTIVIRTAGGTKHEAARKRRVAFEVDGYDLATGQVWSVVAKGQVVEVHDVEAALAALRTLLVPWAEGAKRHLLRLQPDSVTGRRFDVMGGARRR